MAIRVSTPWLLPTLVLPRPALPRYRATTASPMPPDIDDCWRFRLRRLFANGRDCSAHAPTIRDSGAPCVRRPDAVPDWLRRFLDATAYSYSTTEIARFMNEASYPG